MTDRIGQQLGNYHLLRMLGQGQFAAVYLGEHQYLERPAAIKTLHVRMEAENHRAFLYEARTIAQLRHPHIIDIHDFGIEDQTPYLVMEYMPNGTLRSRYPKGTRLPFEEIVTYARQIASALDYAHEHHVIHRDVKPENILLRENYEAVLSDFGIAIVQSTLESFYAQDLAGTSIYMAPEQIQRKPCAASDQYALGVMVYEWLCGEPPFHGSLFEVLSQHLHKPPPSLCTRLPQLSPTVEDVVFGALAKEPERRFESVTDFALVLSEAFFATQPLLLCASPEYRVQNHTAHAPTQSTSVADSFPHEQAYSGQSQIKTTQSIDHKQGWVSSSPPQSTIYNQRVLQPARPSLAHTNRERLLQRVRSFWITGVLEQSLHGATLLALGLHRQTNAIADPWHLIVQQPDTTPRPLPTGTHITQVYDAANGELLILGAPGAGKTTLLLQLACDLLDRAEHDEQHPMPVIFNLFSWAMKRQALVNWLIEELNHKYQVPRRLGKALVNAGQILPLLDGLDEVAPQARTACIEVINTYREEYGLLPLVVCSRSADYLEQTTRVLVRSAVMIQPLAAQQVDTYLLGAGRQLEALRLAIHRDPDLQELVKTPLMLNILTLAYQGTSPHEIALLKTLPAKQQQIFSTYVQRMLTRQGKRAHSTPEQTVHWLSYLARQMREHNQTIFYLEHLQPDWLAPRERRIYVWLGILLPDILMGILVSLSLFLFLDTLLQDALDLSSFHLITLGILGGLWGALFSQATLGRPPRSRQQALRQDHFSSIRRERSPLRFIQTMHPRTILLVIAGVALGIGLAARLSGGDLGIALSVALSAGLGSVFLSLLLSLQTQGIRLTKRLRWTWNSLMRSLSSLAHITVTLLLTGPITIIIGLSYWWLDIQLFHNSLTQGLGVGLGIGLSVGLGIGLSYWLLLGLLQGISREQIEEHLRQVPGEGIHASLRHSLLTGLIGWGVLWLISTLGYGVSMWLAGVPSDGPIGGFHDWLVNYGPNVLLAWTLRFGWVLGLCGGLVVCLVNGGLAVWRHGILRLLLQRSGKWPSRCVRFFNSAASATLLQKVGGGYSFIHRLLLDYFAERELNTRNP